MVCFWCFVLFVPAIFSPWPKAWVAEWVQSQHWTESHDLSRQAAGWSKKAKDGRIFFGFCGRFLRILYLSIIEHLHWVSGHDYEHDLRMASALGMLGSIDCNAGQPYLGWDTDEFPSDPRTFDFRDISAVSFNQDFLSFGSRFFCMVVMVQEVLAIYADCGGAGRHCTGWQQLWLQATPREHRHWGVTDLAWWLALKVSSKQQKNTARNGSKKLEEGVATSWNSLVDNRKWGNWISAG